jgi:hypothetical protein
MNSSPCALDVRMPALIAALNGADLKERQAARRELTALGAPAVPALTSALFDSRGTVQWQAAKALTEVCDPASAPALVRALQEISDFGVRWLAADALICLGTPGLEAVLEGLVHHADSIWLCEAARHVLHSLYEGGMEGEEMSHLLYALEGVEPALQVPWTAAAVLDQVRKLKPGRH